MENHRAAIDLECWGNLIYEIHNPNRQYILFFWASKTLPSCEIKGLVEWFYEGVLHGFA